MNWFGTNAIVFQLSDLNTNPFVTFTPTNYWQDDFVGQMIARSNLMVLGQAIRATNQGATTMDFNKPISGFATNASFAIAGLANILPYGTNVEQCTLLVTNTGASPISITTPASFFMGDGTVHYVTNQSYLAVIVYPGMGTNAVYGVLR